jgi:MYXO-CTERM domain-containing protein
MKNYLLTLGLVLVAIPATAADVPCMSDGDCGADQACVVLPCAVPACPPDTECQKPVDCGLQGYCAAVSSDGKCLVDADCPVDFACESVSEPCAWGGCAPCACSCPADGDCSECECPPCQEPPPCTPTVRNFCQYHPAPCAIDADCKAGWECKSEEICSGTGCACPSCSPEMECPACDCPPDQPPACEVLGAWCQPKSVLCKTATDCAEGFECIEYTSGGDCMCPACACAPETPDCGCSQCDCPSATTTQVCMPIGWAAAGIDEHALSGGTGTPRDDGDATSTPVNYGSDNAGGEIPASTSPTGTNESGVTPPASGNGGNGCQSSATPGAPLGLALILAGAMILGLRRRVHASRQV